MLALVVVVAGALVVVGAGVIGIEYASVFAALGTRVTVIERRDQMLEFCDEEIVQALEYHLRDLAVSFRLRESVELCLALGMSAWAHPAHFMT